MQELAIDKIQWDNDTPHARQSDIMLFFIKGVGYAFLSIFVSHVFHFLSVVLFPRLQHQFDKSIWLLKIINILLKILCGGMICAYFTLFFCTKGILWAYTTFNTQNRILVFIYCLTFICLLIVLEVFIFSVVYLIWKKEFILKSCSLYEKYIYIIEGIPSFYKSKKRWIVILIIIVFCIFAISFCSISYGLCWPNEPDNDFSAQ